MAGRLLRVTAPVLEPVTLEEAKAHLRVPWAEEDDLITRLIAAARAEAEAFTRRSLITQEWQITLDGFPPGASPISLRRPPVSAIVSLDYTDGTGHSFPAGHILVADPVAPRIQPHAAAEWPAGIDGVGSVRARYRAGYGPNPADVPPDVRQALLLIVGRHYSAREDVVMGRAVPLPMGSRHLLSPYRLFS